MQSYIVKENYIGIAISKIWLLVKMDVLTNTHTNSKNKNKKKTIFI